MIYECGVGMRQSDPMTYSDMSVKPIVRNWAHAKKSGGAKPCFRPRAFMQEKM